MRAIVALASIAVLTGCGSGNQTAPAPTPKVLVGLAPVKRGSQPEWLTAYGSALPAVNGTLTISIPQPGQVTELAVAPGMAVRKGQTLGIFTVAPSGVSAYQQAATALATARKQRATTVTLLSQQLATRDQLAQADKAVLDAQSALAALEREGAGTPVRKLVAPFDGVVTNVAVAQGDRTQPGAALITIARNGDIIAAVGVEAAARDQVRTGQQVRIARLNGEPPVIGHVILTGASLNPRSRMIDVGVAFPAGSFLPNEALKADIATRQVSGWLVPHAAVVTANGPARIFQLAGGKAHAVRVNVLLTGDSLDVVDGPVDAGKPLIVDGAYQVKDGDVVRVGRPS